MAFRFIRDRLSSRARSNATATPCLATDVRSKVAAASLELAMGASALGIFADAAFATYCAVLATNQLIDSVLPEVPVEPI